MTAEEIIAAARERGWFQTPEAGVLQTPEIRADVYRTLHPRAEPADRPLLRALLALEVEYRAAEEDFDHYESLYWCAFLLYRLGFVDDVLPLWRAKHTNMDTGVGLDVQYLVGAGIERTLAWLRASTDTQAPAALEYLERGRQCGDFDRLAGWESDKEVYYSTAP